MGFEVGLRQVRRIYAERGLSVRRRLRRRLKPALRRPMTPATKPNERWSMDFVHDQLADARCFRVFAVVDDFTRESVVLAVGVSLTSADIAVALREAMLERGKPERLGCDNGPEFRSGHFQRRARDAGYRPPIHRPRQADAKRLRRGASNSSTMPPSSTKRLFKSMTKKTWRRARPRSVKISSGKKSAAQMDPQCASRNVFHRNGRAGAGSSPCSARIRAMVLRPTVCPECSLIRSSPWPS